MAKTPDVVVQEMLAKLKITAPGLSFELGTPERKMLDAVGESISECYIDQYLVGSLLDIESKAGLELEQFVGIFGFGRLQGRKASGVVRVELGTASQQDMPIPSGTQFYTRQALPNGGSQLYFTSTQSAMIPAGSYVADIVVECTVVGTVGNVPPDSIVYLGSIIGSSSVTNLTSMTGGVDVETDAELRQRFKDTFMRNIAGTEDWYLGLALQNKNVSRARCIGPISKYVTQIVVPNGIESLVNDDVKFAWPGVHHVSVFKNLGQEDETFYRAGEEFDWYPGPAPQLERIDKPAEAGGMVPGEVVDVEYEYTSTASRNDPSFTYIDGDVEVTGITNKVDLFVNGSDPCPVTERTVITDKFLSTDPDSELYFDHFARVGSSGSPSSSNRFMRLGSVPVVSFPSSIVIEGTNYQQGVHYHLLRSTTLLAGSTREVAGLEWTTAGPDIPIGTGTPVTVNYVYNRVPEVLGAVVKQGKQVTTDVLVHQASYAYLRVYLSIEYDRGFVTSQVNNGIQDRLRAYFAGLPFGDWIEVSDLMLAVRQVLGVDNVWLTTSAENPLDFGIKVYGDSSDPVDNPIGTPHATDFKLRDNQLPVFIEAVILRKANR